MKNLQTCQGKTPKSKKEKIETLLSGICNATRNIVEFIILHKK
jgi:hypothetical protein